MIMLWVYRSGLVLGSHTFTAKYCWIACVVDVFNSPHKWMDILEVVRSLGSGAPPVVVN